MKNSGIKWIGEIPDDWEQTRLKNLFIDRCGGAWGDEAQDNEYDRICIRVADIDFEKQTIKAGDKTIRNYQSKVIDKLTLRENDLLIEKSGGGEKMPVGRTILATECPGVLFANFIDRLRIRTSQNAKFIAYLFRALYNNGITLSYIKKTTGIQNLDVENLLSEVVYTPRTEYQHSIATYLDKKCAEIDCLIAHEETMIDELKAYKQSVITEAVTKGLDRSVPMKDSGVEWIGEIPEHWATAKLKNVCKIFGRIGFRGYRQDDMVDEGEGAITLSPSNMRDMKMNYEKCSYLSWEKYFESPEIQIHNGNILFVKTGSTFGKVALVDNLLFEATVNPQIIVLKNFTILNKYLCYFLCTPIIRAQVDCTVVGGTIPTISQEKIYNYSVLIPPTKEQQQIAEYLDRKCSGIDRLISLKQEKIEELRDYKKSLIYEYVTGKKEVC